MAEQRTMRTSQMLLRLDAGVDELTEGLHALSLGTGG